MATSDIGRQRVAPVPAARILFALVLLACATVATPADEAGGIRAAQQALDLAETYHRLSRATGNDIHALETALAHARAAQAALEGIDTAEARSLRAAAGAAVTELGIRYENNFDTIGNEVPLFALLTGRNRIYEYADDPDVVAATRAAEHGIAALRPPLGDLQFDTLVVSVPENAALEDEIWALLNGVPRFRARATEEILRVITPVERRALYDVSDAGAPIRRLAESWGSTAVMHVTLSQKAIVDDVYRFGVDFRLWDADGGGFGPALHAEGFSQDRRGAGGRVALLLAAMLLAAVAAPFIHRAALVFRESHDRGRVHLWTAPLSSVMGVLATIPVAAALSPLAPQADALAVLARSRVWLLGLPVATLGASMVLSYLLLARIPASRERLSHAESLASILTGAALGTGTVLLAAHLVRFGYGATAVLGAAAYAGAIIAGAWAGEGLFQLLTRGHRAGLVPPVLAAATLVVLLVGVMRSAPALVTGAAGVLVGGFLLTWIVRLGLKHRHAGLGMLGARASRMMAAAGERMTLQRLSLLAREPEHYVDPSESGDFLETKAAAFLDFLEGEDGSAKKQRPVYAVVLEGASGSGKTRTAEELAERVLSKYAEAHGGRRGAVLFGDCDEMNADGSGVPYEPFAQALYDLLGAGRFEPPSKRASKVSEGLKKAGLETALGAVGLGALGSLMGVEADADDPGAGVGTATAAEMAYTVSRTLIELTQTKDAPVILILDDLHWLDAVTHELFERVLYELIGAARSDRVMLILTADPDRIPRVEDGTDDAHPGARALAAIESLSESRGLLVDRVGQDEISNRNRFDNVLVDALHFERDSAGLLLRKLAPYAPDRIQSILRSVTSLVELDGLEITAVEQRVRIKRSFDFSELPPPEELRANVKRSMQELSEEQISLIECAAFVGYEFNAEILADVLDLDRLHVLQQLRILEDKDIVYDVINQDDVYAFRSKAFAAALRHYISMAESDLAREVPQVVREYHHRVARSITKRMERWGDTVDTIPINDLIALARRSFAAGDRMLEDAFTFNRAAALRTLTRGRYREAAQFAGQAVEVAGKLRDFNRPGEVFHMRLIQIETSTIVGYSRRYVEELLEAAFRAVDAAAAEQRQPELITLTERTQLWMRRADLLLRPRDAGTVSAGEWAELADALQGLIADGRLGASVQLQTELARARVVRMVDPSVDHAAAAEGLLVRCERLIAKGVPGRRLLRLRSELLEDIATELYDAGEHQRAETIIGRAIEAKQDPMVGDQEGIAKLRIYLGATLAGAGRTEEALREYREAMALADRSGSTEHVVSASNALGTLLHATDTEDAFASYSRGFREAAAIGDVAGQYESLTGILRIARDTGDDLLAAEFLDEAADLLELAAAEHQSLRNELVAVLRDLGELSGAAAGIAGLAAGRKQI